MEKSWLRALSDRIIWKDFNTFKLLKNDNSSKPLIRYRLKGTVVNLTCPTFKDGSFKQQYP